MKRTLLAALTSAVVVAGAPRAADAFCGFYVSGAGADLFNNATLVVMMRSGTRTVLSMQNSYKGPTADFAMVVPVPVVLQEENVKTLPPEIFARVDKLAAPRLVEYWETDPCEPEPDYENMKFAVQESGGAPPSPTDSGVTIEAQFKVAEYDIVILSAKDATGLDNWLRAAKYKIPAGAEPFLRPYVESGSKFFVAKVDASKVKFVDGQAMLSPLRFHYDSQDFSLPIRLGMINSEGTQDLIVHILAPGQRYEVANYKNATIPTNLNLTDEAKTRFGEFYAALFDRTLEKNPQSVITEYAWDATSCDPCPEPALDMTELTTLGADVLTEGGGGFVLTRLHARYAKGGISEDLVFKEAPPIVGGREFLSDGDKLEEGSRPGGVNNFQGRYAIRHKWEGKVACDKPIYGRWGGPPSGNQPVPVAATDLAFVERGKLTLASVVTTAVPEIDLKPEAATPTKPTTSAGGATTPQPKKKGCGCQSGDGGGSALAFLFVLGLALGLRRRRRREPLR